MRLIPRMAIYHGWLALIRGRASSILIMPIGEKTPVTHLSVNRSRENQQHRYKRCKRIEILHGPTLPLLSLTTMPTARAREREAERGGAEADSYADRDTKKPSL